MYVQIITYSLEGIDEQDYLDVANQLAARVAGVPGLLAKVWLENEGGNRYGGVYFWEDLESMERFGRSDLFEGRVPEFTDSVVEEFGVLENLTASTQPVLQILEPQRAPAVSRSTPLRAPAKKAAKKTAAKAVEAGSSTRGKRTPPPRKSAVAEAPPQKAAKKAPARRATRKAR